MNGIEYYEVVFYTDGRRVQVRLVCVCFVGGG